MRWVWVCEWFGSEGEWHRNNEIESKKQETSGTSQQRVQLPEKYPVQTGWNLNHSLILIFDEFNTPRDLFQLKRNNCVLTLLTKKLPRLFLIEVPTFIPISPTIPWMTLLKIWNIYLLFYINKIITYNLF